MKKKILFLGGSHFQIPPLKYAKEQGHYIITCDYLPGNPGHKYGNEYHNVSTTDEKAILHLARKLHIDGIVAYGSDPAALTAAYVAEILKLPGNPYKSVKILSRKDLYRNFLRENNFQTPWSAAFVCFEEAVEFVRTKQLPVVIKPVDASGSKGVSQLNDVSDFSKAYHFAMSYSRSRKIIIEEYIQRKGYQIAGDGFVLNNKLVFRCFAQEHFLHNGNPYLPLGESFPLILNDTIQQNIHNEIERLMLLLEMKVGGLNFDIMLTEKNAIYLMEVGARNGGNLISDIINYSTGINLSKYVVDGALGLNCNSLAMYTTTQPYCIYILNATKNGLFNGVTINSSILGNIVKQLLFVEKGEPVELYRNSSHSLGCLIMKFNCAKEMIEKMDAMGELVQVNVV